jgi:hypothetical protein
LRHFSNGMQRGAICESRVVIKSQLGHEETHRNILVAGNVVASVKQRATGKIGAAGMIQRGAGTTGRSVIVWELQGTLLTLAARAYLGRFERLTCWR